jgi:phage protein U
MQDKNFCRFGDVSFTVLDGITGFSSETGFEYARHDIATGKPTLQAMGETLQQVTLEIMLRSFIGHDVAGLIETLETMKASGEAKKLVFGSGIYQGNFVLTGISAKVLRTDKAGVLQSADLTLNLMEFADRETQTRRKTETKPAGEKTKRTLTTE